MAVCTYCHKSVRHPNYIALVRGKERICRNCHTPSVKDGALTRTSQRVVSEREHNKADFVIPHVWDKYKKKMVINPDFTRLYPDKMRYYENEETVSKAGFPKLGNAMKKQKETIKRKKENIEFTGNTREGVKKIIGTPLRSKTIGDSRGVR